MSAITANVRFSSTANIEIGFGPNENYLGNLVPLSGGVTYDENLAISYVPLQGEKHLRALLTPVSLDTLGLLLNMNFEPDIVMGVAVKCINDVPNADFLSDSSQEADQRFAQLLRTTARLSRGDKLTLVQLSEEDKSYHVLIHDYLP